jgi:hypothetical protein
MLRHLSAVALAAALPIAGASMLDWCFTNLASETIVR